MIDSVLHRPGWDGLRKRLIFPSTMLSFRVFRWCDLACLYPAISLLLLAAVIGVDAGTTVHDDSFKPDAVLHVTAKNFKLGGIQRFTTLVNGSVPGPELRIPEGEVAWIRVYNDMENANLTMVSSR